MPDETPPTAELLKSILQEQLTEAEESLHELPPRPSYSPKKPAPGERSSSAPKATPEEWAAAEKMHALTDRVMNLQEVLGLFHRDPELMRLVDASIQKRMQTAEKRQATLAKTTLEKQAAIAKETLEKQEAAARATQRRQTIITVILSVVFLVAGWLLSAISPVSAVSQFVGR